MKIYTKTGDNGTTALIGGKRVPKYHERIEAYGTVDELISYLALIRDHDIPTQYKDELLHIQDKLMIMASILAADDPEKDYKLPVLQQADIEFLEQSIDNMDNILPMLTSFVLPGGHMASSFCHVARNICRKTERIVIHLAEKYEIPDLIIRYLNRLSDYLFVLGRIILFEKKINETHWKPRI
ncbi:MAG: cob(I)yrinic acid a,c-diamide adenosyltransferase [Bacteroidetes bacterium]|jgi:cob(I)alamin adenosyltransferase|nr:cob(I)yrinic acid a,c-diamide adenosyltransferase [Bacteroidota bacterium]